MPFYQLNPKELTLRSEFFTSFPLSSNERKHNIKLASKALDNTFVDVNGEFSFNRVVGERTAKRGYKNAKIIYNGEFVDGIGGGVCQVSTTLYNAVLLAGLEIIEYHPHSLSVSYVAPSFDAMVNSNTADLRFRNNTDNPIIIKTLADNNKIIIQIYGESLNVKYIRKSVLIEEIPPLEDKIIDDQNLEYEDLYEDEFQRVSYGKKGLISEGYLVVVDGEKISEVKKIRSDKYLPTAGQIIKGQKKREQISKILTE